MDFDVLCGWAQSMTRRMAVQNDITVLLSSGAMVTIREFASSRNCG